MAVSNTPARNIQVFTANGNWIKPIGPYTYLELHMIGGGGGGGSGARRTTKAGGGAGGAGGAYGIVLLPFNTLASSCAVVVGQGGAGGTGLTVNSAGNPGANGTNNGNFGQPDQQFLELNLVWGDR